MRDIALDGAEWQRTHTGQVSNRQMDQGRPRKDNFAAPANASSTTTAATEQQLR